MAGHKVEVRCSAAWAIDALVQRRLLVAQPAPSCLYQPCAHSAPPQELLSQLEREERAGGEQALRPVLPARFLCLQLAVLTAVFLLLVAERLLVQHIWPAPQQG